MKNKFKERIRQLRIAKGLSQASVAKEIGVTPNAITNYELGIREPDFDTLIKLANFFGETTDFILGLTD